MQSKTVVAFWTFVAAAVFLLGGTVASAEALAHHLSTANAVVLSLSILGSIVAWTIAGRIILVVGRAQRRTRSPDA